MAEPHPYKILYGGRDAAKSWGIAQQLVLNGAQRPLRWLCCREIQRTIAESVHKLLANTIVRLGVQDNYRVFDSYIENRRGGEFIFAGLKNAKNIKSYEDCDGAWLEEGQTTSRESREILIPTIRKPGSEIWVSFNPEFDADDCYQYWVLNPPPGAKVVKVSYEDNPWLSETSRAKIEHLRTTDPETFAHIYGGECRSSVQGAVYAREMAAARAEGRICEVPYNRTRPVHTIWDLGFGDFTFIWFLQVYDGWYHFIDCLQGEGETITDYMVKLQNRGYLYGIHWLPHDGVDTIIHQKLAGDRSMSIEQIMRQGGLRVRIVPKMLVTEGINAARTIFRQCKFDEDKCRTGLTWLRLYQWGPVPDSGILKREPLHNKASHAADAFRGAAIAVKAPPDPDPDEKVGWRPPPPRTGGRHSWLG